MTTPKDIDRRLTPVAATQTAATKEERSLDPDDWSVMRALGHRMIDDMMDFLEHIRTRPVWQPIPETVRHQFRTAVPVEGIGAAAAYQEFREQVLPYPIGNIHPRFWGWVGGAGTPFGMLAELLAAGMNTNAWGNEQAASEVEHQVLTWFKTIFCLPESASGVLTTGGSVANIVALCVARDARAGFDPMRGWDPAAPHPVLYCSTETHNSVDKAASVLGLGTNAIRRIAVRPDYAIDIDGLQAALEADSAAGHRPFCIVANVGTVNTGAIDNVRALADLARAHGAWLHVDGAFGALAVLAPGYSDLRDAMSAADSIAFDLHKWLSVPYDCGCVLVRDAERHRATFSPPASYITRETRGTGSGHHRFIELGLELSRGFRALKVWMLMKEHGLERFGQQIAQNIRQAAKLAEIVSSFADLELAAPVTLNIVCFRARPTGVAEADLNELNREVLLRLQERGIAVPSSTTLAGRFVVRAAIVNHRSRMEDFRALVDAVRAIAAEVAAEHVGPAHSPKA